MSGSEKGKLNRLPQGERQIVDFLTEATGFARSLTGMVKKYSREIHNDGVCGSWISRAGNRALLIRKCGSKYNALLCDTSRLYKVVERELEVVVYRGGLCIAEHGEPVRGEMVRLYPSQQELLFGNYGIFDTEECVIAGYAYSEEFIVDFSHDD